MSFRITVEKLGDGPQGAVLEKLYEQTVEEIDLRAVMAGVNKKPRKSRAKAEPEGKPRVPSPGHSTFR